MESIVERLEFSTIPWRAPDVVGYNFDALRAVLRPLPDEQLASAWRQLLNRDAVDCLNRCSLSDDQMRRLVDSLRRLTDGAADSRLPLAACCALLKSTVFNDALPDNIGQVLVAVDGAQLIVSLLDARNDVPERTLLHFIKYASSVRDRTPPCDMFDELMLAILKQPYTPSAMCALLRTLDSSEATNFLRYLNKSLDACTNNSLYDGERRPSPVMLIDWANILIGAQVDLTDDAFQHELEICEQLCNAMKRNASASASGSNDVDVNCENYYIQTGWY